VLALAQAATAADGVAPLSEQVLLHLRYGGAATARNLLLWHGHGLAGHRLAGYAHLGPTEPGGGRSGELVIHPAYRGHGLGLMLARAAVTEPGALPVRLWAHGDQPAAAALAATAGFTRVRALWQMRRSLRDAVPEPRLPSGITLRAFRPGQDEDAWITVNARAFADHPEQGKWTRDDLLHREAGAWFDPAGFFLATRDGHLAGFHWTKIHQPGGHSPATGTAPGEPEGEVYVVGVDPTEQGTGLGKALTLTGLRYLRDRGLPTVMLYVDEENTPAIRLYGSLGFVHASTDVMYAREAAYPAGPTGLGA
jgi:mycothiol synthase